MPLASIIIAGIASGSILGFTLASNSETEYKRLHIKNDKAFAKNSQIKIFLSVIFKIVFVAFAMIVVGVGIIRAGDAYPLSQSERYILLVAWMSSVGLAKYLRYCYWKSKRANEF